MHHHRLSQADADAADGHEQFYFFIRQFFQSLVDLMDLLVDHRHDEQFHIQPATPEVVDITFCDLLRLQPQLFDAGLGPAFGAARQAIPC